VDLAWTIYSGGRFSANDQKWRGEQTLSEHQAQLLLQQLMVDVALAYFNLVQQQAIEQVAEKNVQLSRDRHEKAQTRQSLGQDSQSQLLDAYSALLSDEASLAEQRERVTEALALLKQRMFYPLDDALTIQMDALPDIPPVGDLDSWLQRAREHNLALKELNAQETVLEAAVAEAQSAFRPTLTFQSGLAYGDSRFALSGVNTNAHQATWDLALVGSIDLFDGYQRKTTLANRTIDVAQTQWLRKQELHELDHEVKKWHQQLTQQQLRVQHQQNTLATAQTYLQLQEERFQMGLIDALSFRDAQLRLARSAQGLIAAQFDALNSYLQLLRLTADAEAIGSLSP
jgi:outer membrane protein TolC